jgi:hypothetical protein
MMKWGFVNTLLVFTVGWWMIHSLGPIGGAWFWVLQAVLLIPLVRFPLIHQELNTLEYLRHVWQPVLSGVIASLCGYLIIVLLPNGSFINIMVSMIGYAMVYILALFFLDRGLIRSIKNIFFLLKD